MRRVLAALGATILASVALGACGRQSAVPGTSAAADAIPASVPSGDWTQFNYDAQRSGVGPADTGITAGDVGALETRVVHVDGTVDSSAVELHGISVRGRVRDVLFVTTTYGKTIAIDPRTGARLWEYTPSDIGSYEGGPQITTATPIVDPDRHYLYASSPDGRIHKLSVGTGREVRSGHWPVGVTLLAGREKIASPFNISGNELIVVTDGYDGDTPPYQGHVVAIDRSSGRITHVWNSLCSNRRHLMQPSSCPGSDSAIWGRAAPIVEPGNRRILIATGNGPFNGSTDWGDSVLELSPDASRLLHNWTPAGEAQMNANDTDLGSTSPAILPPIDGYRLAVQGGKDGMLHLLNLNRLDGTTGGAGPRLGGELQDTSSPGGDQVFTAPAVWSHDGRPYVFVADNSGTAAYTIRIGRSTRLVRLWQNGTPGTSPVLAGGLLYVYDLRGGVLNVYGPARGRLLRTL
ncbi:MAG TPA: PQQ-binding-like beta-propeller repeat protein, partial [Solirubrobacteraceae bacterium]|nr:PQQ-binding-like beta-propeller repeat protein [Solirubrobacteraceae bacterium]